LVVEWAKAEDEAGLGAVEGLRKRASADMAAIKMQLHERGKKAKVSQDDVMDAAVDFGLS
jgi:hypothetical protein